MVSLTGVTGETDLHKMLATLSATVRPGRFASWLTLEVHSSLEAVGLTAAISAALGAQGISCNVLAGYYHDHILVPVDRTEDALACLQRLRGDLPAAR